MQYRKFGKQDFEVSALGFGLMRLPLCSEDSGDIDEEKAAEMVDYAMQSGVNYFDTAYGYHGGNSERFAGKVFSGRRDKIRLATKLPSWLIEETADFERYFGEQLEKLDTDYVDAYMLHGMNENRWSKLHELGILEFMDRVRSDGRAKTVGFSFHDELNVFKAIVDAFDWDMCLIQLNFMDHEYQAGVAGLRYAAQKGMAVTVMEPLRGGKLAENVPDDVLAIWDRSPMKRSPAEWALRWVWDHPEVTTVLSGMSTLEQLEENVTTVSDAYPGSLSDEEVALIEEVRDIYLARMKVNCTGCEYCLPCPQEVAIPRILSLYNDASMFGSVKAAARMYARVLENERGAPSCVECGQCEEACPQDIPIIEALQDAHRELAPGKK